MYRMPFTEFEDKMAVLIGRLAKEYNKSNVQYSFAEWYEIFKDQISMPIELPDDTQ